MAALASYNPWGGRIKKLGAFAFLAALLIGTFGYSHYLGLLILYFCLPLYWYLLRRLFLPWHADPEIFWGNLQNAWAAYGSFFFQPFMMLIMGTGLLGIYVLVFH